MKRSDIHPHVVEDIKQWPATRLYSRRKEFVDEVTEFTTRRVMEQTGEHPAHTIARAAYLETIRIKEEPWKVDLPDEMSFWRKVKKKLAANPNSGKLDEEALLRRIVARYSEEIVGGFRPQTFRFARRFLTQFFKVIFNTAWSLGRGRLFGNRRELQERIKVYGHVDELRDLMTKGTVVMVPTHFSNLDSIMVGYALDAVMGVPSMTYGAGLNLFNNRIVARYMSRLGAYRVDRRKKNQIYLETLKGMSNLAIQKGTHSLFFPGGTRSRSGALEDRLKLGLLGTAVEAQRAMLQRGAGDKVFVVPVVIGYHFVLEAKSLITQHLSKTGEELFIPTKMDESLRIPKIIKFAWQYFSRSSEITLSVGQPLDVIGNRVDAEGRSLDQRGNPMDISGYFTWDGKVGTDLQREHEYTRRLADKIVDSFKKYNMVLSSHLVAHAAFLLLRKQQPDPDIYALLRLPVEEFEMPFGEFCQEVDRLRQQLFALEEAGKVGLSDEIRWDIEELVKDGLSNIGLYHDKNPLYLHKKTNIVKSKDFYVLYFYHNRLKGFGLKLQADSK